MTRRDICLFAGLILVVGAGVASLAAAPRSPSGPRLVVIDAPGAPDADILVDDAPLPRYPHGGRLYVEAMKGREYAIRLHNPYPVRVAVALTVDGLNTIDGRETTASDAAKWLIEPYGIVTVRGWQTGRSEARQFEFTTEARSYGQARSRTANLGTIAAAFFKERVPRNAMSQARPLDDDRRKELRQQGNVEEAMPPAAPAPSEAESAAGAAADARAGARVDEFAATGMGRRRDNEVREVALDIEDTPARTVTIRYEFRHQLVRLGIVPRNFGVDPLTRREGAHGFEPAFSPVPRGW